MIKTEKKFPWLTTLVEDKMKGLNWTRQNNKPVWYENEPMQIVLSLRPIDEEPPDYILETKEGEHLKVNLLNRKLLFYKKGTKKPNFEKESDLLNEENIDVCSSSKLSARMENHISSLSSTKRTKSEAKTQNMSNGSTAQQLLGHIDIENERTEDLIAEINLYFQFFGSKMFKKIEDSTISELAQIGIGAEPYDKDDRSKNVLKRKRKRKEISPPEEDRSRVKREKIQTTEMSAHIVKILNQKLGNNQDFYLTYNCVNCHGIFTSVVEDGEVVEHLCTSAGNKKIRQKIRPRGKKSQVQALQVAVV